MHILVTGGAGFIGGKLSTNLLDRGHDVFVIDNMATGLKTNLDPRAKFFEVGAESPMIFELLKNFKFDAIAHLGGNSSGENGELSPVDDINWNVVSTLNLLNLSQKFGIRRFVYASSMGVYGQPEGLAAIPESTICAPISIYGAGKICAENYLRLFAQRGMATLALRMFNVYGPGQNLSNPRQGMISIYMEQRLRGPNIVVKGSLDRVRDFVFIDDAVEAWTTALESSSGRGFAALNIATGVSSTVRDVLVHLESCAGQTQIEVQDPTPADQRAVVGSPVLIMKTLNWRPKTELSEGISKMWSWAKGS
jgi:UDP-glucose 4-epimerase